MTKHLSRKLLSVLLVVLLAVAALSGCADNNTPVDTTPSTTPTTPKTSPESPLEMGEGQNAFNLEVTDDKGEVVYYLIHTGKETVGEALQEVGLVTGEVGEYGLFIQSVNGLTADYNVDQSYWAFYVNGEYAMASADQTAIEADTVYSLVYTKE